ncbi:MAG: DUF362 domain-containing protein, partial [Omnitrophica WOR_2 bacterium]
MRIHPYLLDPRAVLVLQTPPADGVQWEDFQQAAGRAMAILQVELEGERAVIKPNITSGERFIEPDTGITTHPGFVKGMVAYLQKHGARDRQVTIVEDPRNTDDNVRRNWEKTCYQRVAQETGAKLHFPSTYTCVKKSVPQPLARPVLNVSRLATAQNTALFNVPKLKNHNLAITTLCMKNLMGLVSVFDRHFCLQSWQEMPPAVLSDRRPRHEWFTPSMHEQWQIGLARRLVDTAQVIHPALNIVEGIVGREGTGFQRGRNRALGLVVAGINMVAVDSLASYLMGFEPQEILYLRLAAGAGLGEIEISRLRVYTEQEGEIIACPDVARLRIDPPFRVIKNIQGEDPDPFGLAGSGIVDASDTFFGKSKA